jgi:aspartyl-tRNA(Asn)/glutamyl-tRNA(Gln) amidotransferase subunit A
MLAAGGFAGGESYAWHHRLLERSADGYDPRVRLRIEQGAAMKAWEYIELHRTRNAWIERVARELQGFDAVLSPTVPLTAPPIERVAPGAERDEEFFRINALLLRNTGLVNMLDGCAISIPCHAPGELPVGLMLWHGALQDDAVLSVALQAEAALTSVTRAA